MRIRTYMRGTSPTRACVLSGVKRGRCDAMTDAYNRNGKKDGGHLYRRDSIDIYNLKKNRRKYIRLTEIKL